MLGVKSQQGKYLKYRGEGERQNRKAVGFVPGNADREG
jgi:hypothetical protein